MTFLKRSIAALVLSGTALSAMADNDSYWERSNWDVHPYLGIDVQDIDSELSKDHFTMVGVVGGIQLNDYLGLEIHWQQNTNKKFKLATDEYIGEEEIIVPVDVKIENYGVGVTFQADLYKRLYAKSYMGYGRFKGTVSTNVVDGFKLKYSDKADVITAKIGLGYQISPDFAIEATYNNNFAHQRTKNLVNNDGASIQFKYYF